MTTNHTRTIAHLLPMFLQMLKDEFPDVRLHIISKLELVNKGMQFLQVVFLYTASHIYSNRYRTTITIVTSSNRPISGRQAVEGSAGYYRIHPSTSKSIRCNVL